MSKNNSYRYKWIAFLIFSMTSVSFAQMGSLWDLNNKVDDLVFELEMQRLERSSRGYIGSNPFKWPVNLKHLHDEDRGSHFVDPQSIAGNKQSMQANFYVVFPQVKTNKYGTYKAIGVWTVIFCDMKGFQEIAVATYKPDYTVDKIHNQPITLPMKFEPQQSPAEKKYIRYVCGN
jgi:hypothetical protein